MTNNLPAKRTYRKKKEIPLENYLGYMPPFDNDIEELILGTILVDASAINTVAETFNEHLFYEEKNKVVARAICILFSQTKKIDVITVFSEIRKVSMLFDVTELTALSHKVVGITNFETHYRILQEFALKRKLASISSYALRRAYENNEDIFSLYAQTQADLETSVKEIITYKISRVGHAHQNIIEQSKYFLKTGMRSGVPSGLTSLDNITNGWQKPDMIVLAARPGMGKTAFAVSVALHAALKEKKAMGIFSLEMSTEQLVSRMQSALSHVNSQKISKKQLDLADIKQIEDFAAELNEAPIYIDDTPALTLFDFKAKARRMVAEHNVEMIIIDYLQLMQTGYRSNTREAEISEISRTIKSMAKELKIPIIAISQLSRNVENREDKRPQLSDLRESGQIEQDADMVIFCYRPEYYNADAYEIDGVELPAKELFIAIIAKHRSGSLGEVALRFIGAQTKVTNLDVEPRKSFAPFNNSNTFVQPQTSEPNSNNSALNRMRQNLEFDTSNDLPF